MKLSVLLQRTYCQGAHSQDEADGEVVAAGLLRGEHNER